MKDRGKTVERRWKDKERQCKDSGRAMKGRGSAVPHLRPPQLEPPGLELHVVLPLPRAAAVRLSKDACTLVAMHQLATDTVKHTTQAHDTHGTDAQHACVQRSKGGTELSRAAAVRLSLMSGQVVELAENDSRMDRSTVYIVRFFHRVLTCFSSEPSMSVFAAREARLSCFRWHSVSHRLDADTATHNPRSLEPSFWRTVHVCCMNCGARTELLDALVVDEIRGERIPEFCEVVGRGAAPRAGWSACCYWNDHGTECNHPAQGLTCSSGRPSAR